jgi:hypothetical protein
VRKLSLTTERGSLTAFHLDLTRAGLGSTGVNPGLAAERLSLTADRGSLAAVDLDPARASLGSTGVRPGQTV